jgi:CPA2 family monovalent cation:H+ antiporter-2
MPEATHHLVLDLALVLCTAALVTVVCHRLHLPVILGYLLAGVIISPNVQFTPSVDERTIRSLADLGVILLMFSLGLGFTLQKLAKAASTGGIVAPLEMAFSFCLGYVAALLAGYGPLGAVFAGSVFSISSTMVVAKTFEDLRVRDEVATRAYGVLVFEDLVAIALLAGLSAVIASGDVSAGLLWGTMGRLGLFLAILLVGGLFLVPRLARGVVRLRRAETIVVAAAGFAFALAVLAQAAGFSVALGAFLAGALVAESGAGRIVEETVRPLRDVFAAIFFVTIGMLVDPAAVLDQWPAVLVFTVVVAVGKLVGVSAGSVLTGAPVRTAVRTGLALAQIGEFSFILAGVGVAAGVLPAGFLAVVVAVSVLTSGATPALVRRSEVLANWVDRRLPKPLQTWAGLYGSWLEGLRADRGGRRPLAREVRVMLIDAGVLAGIVITAALSRSWAVAALMRGVGLSPRAAGGVVLVLVLAATFPFLLGLLGNGRRLARRLAEQALAPRAVGLDTARAPRTALQRSLEVLIVVLLTAPLVAITLPFVPVYGGLGVLAAVMLTGMVAIWRSAADLRGHVRATAEVVAEALAKQRAGAGGETMEFVRMTLPGIGAPTSSSVPEGSPAVGRSLKELNLRGRTGATVVALVRGDTRIPFPDAEARLAAGDLVALAGTRNAIEAARLVIQTTG